MTDPAVTAIVLAGGQARRFGSDKLSAPFGDGTLLDALLSGLPEDWAVVCVGPDRPTQRALRWNARGHTWECVSS